MSRRSITDDQQQILLLQQKDPVQLSGLFSTKTDPRALVSTQQWHMAYPIAASLAYLPELTDVYMQLAKARLTALVTVTALAGYAMAPEPLTMLSLGIFILLFIAVMFVTFSKLCYWHGVDVNIGEFV